MCVASFGEVFRLMFLWDAFAFYSGNYVEYIVGENHIMGKNHIILNVFHPFIQIFRRLWDTCDDYVQFHRKHRSGSLDASLGYLVESVRNFWGVLYI